jgi:hypothetical protein
MRKLVIAAATAGLLAVTAGSALAAAPTDIKLKPSAGSCNGTGIGNSQNAQAQWTNKTSETGKFSVELQKSAPTTDCSYAAALVKGVEGLTVTQLGTIGFSTDNCGAGAPRFNLLYDTNNDGQYDGVAFYGCANHITGPGLKPGWTRMDVATPTVADNGVVPPTATVVQLYVIVDEQGTYHVDNVTAAGQTTGEPNGA